MNTLFVFYWLQHNSKTLEGLGGGSTVKGLSLLDLKSVALLKPSTSEQTAIAMILADMDTEIVALQQRRDKTQAVKQGMMQELLTGRRRLV